MAEQTARPTVTVQHRGALLQVHVAPWNPHGADHEARDQEGRPKHAAHLHVQDLAGGPGRIVPLTSALARELARHHPEVRAIGGELPEDTERRLEAERNLQAALTAQAAEEERRQKEARELAAFRAYKEAQASQEREKELAEFRDWQASQASQA